MTARGPLPEPAENIKGDIYLHDLGEISDAQLIKSVKEEWPFVETMVLRTEGAELHLFSGHGCHCQAHAERRTTWLAEQEAK